MLEAGRGDDLDQAGRLVAVVPESVPLVAWFDDEVPGLAVDDLAVGPEADASLDHVRVLVLARVAVQGCGQRPRGHGVLDDRDAAAGLLAPGHEANADRDQRAGLSVLRPHDLCLRHPFHVLSPFVIQRCRAIFYKTARRLSNRVTRVYDHS